MDKNIKTNPPTPLFRGFYQNDQFVNQLSYSLYSTLLTKVDFYDIIVICIGTDRSTGDALGPLIGSKLEKLYPEHVSIYGTLDHPVHAVNLEETIRHIHNVHKAPFIIAIDACLGQFNRVGTITLAEGPLKPGAGVQKQLPEVGNLHLTGIVNVGGVMEYFVLQNTRLSIVMSMADNISSAIYYAFVQLNKQSSTFKLNELPFVKKV